LYFFIYFRRSENVDINDISFLDIEDEDESRAEKLECIYQVDTDYDKENQKYYYKMIFKAKKKASKKNDYFEFEVSDGECVSSFEINEKTIFIYDVTLQVGIRIIDIKKFIPQNQIEYTKKLGYFKDALEKI
jgi:hypothetical protein